MAHIDGLHELIDPNNKQIDKRIIMIIGPLPK